MSLDPYRTSAPRPHPVTTRARPWGIAAAVLAAALYELFVPTGIARSIIIASVGTAVVIGVVGVAIYRSSRR